MLSGGDFICNSGTSNSGTNGQVVPQPMQVSMTGVPQAVGVINFATALRFNNLEPLGSVENQNVMITHNSTTDPIANPKRLVYRMRWSTQVSEPTTPAEWDNDGFVTAGQYSTFEVNTQPKIDLTGLGNGDPLFNPVISGGIRAIWVQIIIELYNGIN